MKAKSNSVVSVTQEGDLIHFDVLEAGRVTLDTSKIHADNMKYAAFHGLKQRGSDGAAISCDPETGKPATPAEKQARIQSIVAHLESGSADWRMTGVGGGGKSITIEAIASLQSKAYEIVEAEIAEYAKAKFEGDTKKCLAYLRTGAKVSAKVEELRKARLPAPKVDADNALAELGSK